jgi:hypothetical protein
MAGSILECFCDIILPAALWPWSWLNLLILMSTRNISWGVNAAGAYSWQRYHLYVPFVLKSGSLNLLEPPGPVKACIRIALLLQTNFDQFASSTFTAVSLRNIIKYCKWILNIHRSNRSKMFRNLILCRVTKLKGQRSFPFLLSWTSKVVVKRDIWGTDLE